MTDRFRDDVYCEYYNAMPWHQDPTAQTTMVRTEDYKLTAVHGLDSGELYDLHRIPGRASITGTMRLYDNQAGDAEAAL